MKETAGYFVAEQLSACAPHLALHAPHFAWDFFFFMMCALLAAHFGLHAPHLALHAPHLLIFCLAPHAAPAQPAAMTLPERAAAVTMAVATVLESIDERSFIKFL